MEEMSNVAAIKKFFGESSREVTLQELKSLSREDRQELGDSCRETFNQTSE